MSELDRLWEVRNKTEEEITRLALIEMLAACQEAAAPGTVTGINIEWIEGPSFEVTVDSDDAGVHTFDAYDLYLPEDGPGGYRECLADTLAGIVPDFWEHRPSLLEEVAKDIDIDDGSLETIDFDLSKFPTPTT